MLIPLVGAAGFEPATSWSQTRRDDRTTLRPELLLPLRQFHAPLTFGGLRFTFVKLRHEPCGFSSLSSSTLLRWERDSNPRYGYPYDSLANCWFQPLTHPTSFNWRAKIGNPFGNIKKNRKKALRNTCIFRVPRQRPLVYVLIFLRSQ